jgi:hypothetical protein
VETVGAEIYGRDDLAVASLISVRSDPFGFRRRRRIRSRRW